MLRNSTLLDGGTVVNSTDSALTVEVDGIEVHVHPIVKHSGCHCCGDTAELRVSYNRPQDVDGDPLNIK